MVEQFCALDVNELCRAGCLAPGWRGSWQLAQEGDKITRINLFAATTDRLYLIYRVSLSGGNRQVVIQPGPLVRAPCPRGTRPLFACPCVTNAVPCGRPVAKLYLAGRYFRCHHCHGLSYSIQSQCARDRLMRRAGKIRARLGGDFGILASFPERPPRMWWRTYERLAKQTFELEEKAVQYLAP
jgi:hypothetical protein